jgi:hypothetical protein
MSTTLHTEPSFENQVADWQTYLLKFARLQLRNDTWVAMLHGSR